MHPAVQRQFLGILDSGILQLHSGSVVDFRKTLIIFTSNIGSKETADMLDNSGRIGFAPPTTIAGRLPEERDQIIYRTTLAKIQKDMDPALFSRIGHDGIVVFHALSREDLGRIVEFEIARIQKNLMDEDIPVRIHVADSVKEFILDSSDSPREGARQIKRLVGKHISEHLARALISDQLKGGDEIIFMLDAADRKVIIRRLRRPDHIQLPPLLHSKKEQDTEILKEDIFKKAAGELEDVSKLKYSPQKRGNRRRRGQ
jgi:ATP-dependent Clp protease ATP-binding subunit ClpA